MEVDTGASVSVISEQTFQAIASSTDELEPTDITLLVIIYTSWVLAMFKLITEVNHTPFH